MEAGVLMHARRRQLGMRCASGPRWARGAVGLFAGGLAGGILGTLAAFAVGARKLADDSSEVAPIRAPILTVFGVTIAGAVIGTVAAAVPPEC
jgi:hypothetical protein